MSNQAVRRLFIVLFAVLTTSVASVASGQTGANGGRFVTGPLTWTPALQVREAGIDSNVFNTPEDAKEDISGSFAGQVDSLLKLRVLQLSTRGAAEYVYFERYPTERAVNGGVTSRVLIPWSRFQPNGFVSWTRAKERSSSELDIRAPRTDRGLGAGIITVVGTRFAVNAGIDRLTIEYDRGALFRGVDVATQLNHQTTSITAGLRIALTPLTSIFADAGVARDEFGLKPINDTDNLRANVGFQFAPDAVISGRAMIGYHRMEPRDDARTPGGAVDFRGTTSAVDLSYDLLGRTRFNPRFSRVVNYSVSEASAYFVSTGGGLDILQTLVGPLDLVVRGSRERLVFPETALAAARTDRVDMYGGGLSIRMSTQGRIGINYDETKRRSTAGNLLTYSRRHIYTTVTYGF